MRNLKYLEWQKRESIAWYICVILHDKLLLVHVGRHHNNSDRYNFKGPVYRALHAILSCTR